MENDASEFVGSSGDGLWRAKFGSHAAVKVA
jgi:hypothetical protein